LTNLGYEINFDELVEEAKGGNFGRPHIANILLRKYPDKFEGFQDVFEKLLKQGADAYVRQEKPTLNEVIRVIKNSGGISILAHPGDYECDEELIEKFFKARGEGIEVDYSYDSFDFEEKKKLIEKYRKIAREKGLIVSGGSDYHCQRNNFGIGDYGLTREEFEELKKRVGMQ
jgi:hypothetical protein